MTPSRPPTQSCWRCRMRPYLAQGWRGVVPLLKNGRGLVMDIKARLDRASKPDRSSFGGCEARFCD